MYRKHARERGFDWPACYHSHISNVTVFFLSRKGRELIITERGRRYYCVEGEGFVVLYLLLLKLSVLPCGWYYAARVD